MFFAYIRKLILLFLIIENIVHFHRIKGSSMILSNLISTLQLSIGPVILISGIGLIILSLTNRFGRIVDRTRQLCVEYRTASDSEHDRILSELQILTTRAKAIKYSNIAAVSSVLFVSLIIISLFWSALFGVNIGFFIVALFVFSIISLIVGLALFLYDLELSLKALWIELPKSRCIS